MGLEEGSLSTKNSQAPSSLLTQGLKLSLLFGSSSQPRIVRVVGCWVLIGLYITHFPTLNIKVITYISSEQKVPRGGRILHL